MLAEGGFGLVTAIVCGDVGAVKFRRQPGDDLETISVIATRRRLGVRAESRRFDRTLSPLCCATPATDQLWTLQFDYELPASSPYTRPVRGVSSVTVGRQMFV